MPQNTTPEKLTAQQARVLERLLAGDTVTAAAKAGKVDRSTVHRWLREDPDFQAAYNQRRRELQEAYGARMLSLADHAIASVEHAITNGDVRASMKLLDGLGLLSPPEIGPEEVEAIELAQRRQQNERALEQMIAGGL